VLLVVEGERVVVEVGHAGRDARAPHPLFGASESFWGVVAVAAAEDGLLALDEPVSAALPEFAGEAKKRELRVRQLLDFTSGLESGAIRVGASSKDPSLAGLQLVAPPGERFHYGPSHLFVFAELLSRRLAAAGRDPDPVRYLESRVLAPLGASLAGWERDAAGRADPSTGASLAARDWARFGLLLRERGAVGGRQVVAGERMQAVFQGSRANPTFGLGLWLNALPARTWRKAAWGESEPRPAFYAGGLPDLALAAGAGNQRLYVIPSLDLVVVRFGAPDRRFRDEDLLARLAEGAQAGPRASVAAPG
jgi:CubicO group peptidase (beta-lactamase class C family)